MDKHQSYAQEMEEAFANIRLEEEEHGGLCYENAEEDLSEIDTRWCLVGRFLTEAHIDFQAMQHKMASLWRPGRGLYVKQVEANKFIFQFYHEMDIRRVMEGSPWTFGRFHLVMERLKVGDNPRGVEINNIDLWVQLHGMSSGFMSQRVATDIGNYIGTYIEGDPNNFVGVWRDYLRIRVRLSLNIPIKRRMKLRKSENEWCWANFQYESIPTFCFICGMIGHGERFCDKAFDTPIENIEKPYGPWLRAEARRRTHTMGARWLRNGGNVQVRNSDESEHGKVDKDNPENNALMQQSGSKSGGGVKAGGLSQGVIEGTVTGNLDKINQNIPHQQNKTNSDLSGEGNLNGLHVDGLDNSELSVVDPKRRRVDSTQRPATPIAQNQDNNMDIQLVVSTESKNDLMASSALQTRQSS